MRRQGCMNGTLGESNYSAPIPAIGLYVAAATLVCLLLMLLDFFAAFRQKNRWIPCRFFRLNSVTLTLIAVATKLPVDLTTSMPSALDQLSKITGTVLICIYMGFITPSLGLTTQSECLSNMLALTIFVVTVFVNICIQMRTGVIFLFRAEHIMVLCCMILFLVALWMLAPIAHTQKEISTDYIKGQFTNSWGSLLRRLKVCYLYSYDNSPQLVLCEKIVLSSPYIISLTCTAILVRVTVGCFVLKDYLEFCGRISDYKWSVWCIVTSQIIIILVCCLAATFRLLTMMTGGGIAIFRAFDLSGSWFRNMHLRTLLSPAISVILLIEALFVVPCAFIYSCCEYKNLVKQCCCCCPCICELDDEEEDDYATKEFIELRHGGDMGMDRRNLKRSVKDMERWMGSVKKNNTLNHLDKLLSKTPPSQDSLASFFQLARGRNFCKEFSRPGSYKISSLSVVVLTKVATVLAPSAMSQSLFNSLDEVLKVIHYIDWKLNSSSLRSREISMSAKTLWAAGKESPFTHFTKPEFHGSTSDQLLLELALQNIENMEEETKNRDDYIEDEVSMILDFMKGYSYASIEELCSKIEQLFVDMLNEMLCQLPCAVSKDIIESPPEDLEERIKAALKIVHEIEKLDALIRWSFPAEARITNLITDKVIRKKIKRPKSSTSNNILTNMGTEEIGNAENQSSMPPDCHTGNLLPLAGAESVNHIISETARGEIIEIEIE